MAKILSNLKNIEIKESRAIEEVVSNKDDEDTKTATSTATHPNAALFPHLETLGLSYLDCLARSHLHVQYYRYFRSCSIQHAQVVVVYWSLCQYSRKICISQCHEL